jgi:hypothetical protein
MKLKTLWYLSEFAIFSMYAIVFGAIFNSVLYGILGAAGLMIVHHIVRKALDGIEIEGK